MIKKYMICQKYQQNLTINDIKQHKKRINIIIWVTIEKIIAIVTFLCYYKDGRNFFEKIVLKLFQI